MKRKLISRRMLTLFLAVVLVSSLSMTFATPAAAQVACLHPDVYLCEGMEVNDDNLIAAGVGCDPAPGWYPEEGGYTISMDITYTPPELEGSTPAVGGPYTYTVYCYKTPDGGGGECMCYHDGNIYVVAECTAHAGDFTICVGDPLYEGLFVTEGGAGCSGGCDEEDMDIDYSAVLNMVPGTYPYYVTCDNGVCPPDVATGYVTVEECEVECLCTPNAPDITLCLYCEMSQMDLEMELYFAGAGCADVPNCTEIIDTSQVDICTPGTYPYTVTCIDECEECPVQSATGYVTVIPQVCVEIIEAAGYEPESGWPEDMIVPVSTDFGIKAYIENCSGCILYDVTPYIIIEGPARLVDDPDHWNLGNMEGGEDADSTEVAWTLHCEGPGTVTVTVKVNDCSLDTVTFDQREPAELYVECSSPCEWCTDCEWSTYDVTADIYNVGDTKATDVYALITATPGTDVPDTYMYGWQLLGPYTIEPDDSQHVEWEVDCIGEGDTVFTIAVSGTDLCTGDPLYLECQTTTLQRDVLVYVCADPIDECDSDCDDDIVVSVGQYFDVTAYIENCTDADTTATVTLYLPEGSLIVPGSKADLYCADWTPQNQQATITKGYDPDTATITIGNFCDCCIVEVTWHLQCEAATTGDGSYRVDVVTPGGGYIYSNEPCDPVTVIQQEAADLTLTLQGPFVMDCDCEQLIAVDAVAVCQDYDVQICIINTGEADAYDVEAVIEVSGATDCADNGEYTVNFGDVAGGATECIYLSTVVGDMCHCDGEMPEVRVKVLSTEAYSQNTCREITVTVDDDLCNPGLLIEQCNINVEIVNPETCTNIEEYEVFPVKARINNCGTCDFENALVTLIMEGPVELVDGSENPVLIDYIEAPDEDCDEECRFEEPTWMVRCLGEGEVYFEVCVETETPHLQIKSEQVNVHQVPRDEALVCVEILSPDCGSKYATSEEFAITAKITNLECCAPVTIDVAEIYISGIPWQVDNIVVSDPMPALNWVIGPGESKIVTWTAHCTGSGLTWFGVHLEGISDEYEPVYVYSEPVSVWQYPAAHLEVNITQFPPDPIVTSTEFDVVYTVTNTGEADATEVYAILSVEPEGSVRIAGPSDGGYTHYLGTIPGHGSEASTVTDNYTLHCKMPCDSTIKITVVGNDEYGWHMKQACASTGSFVIEGGIEIVEGLFEGMPSPMDLGEQRGWFAGLFFGDANGLFGPFNATSPVSWAAPGGGPDYMGEVALMGAVIPNVSLTTAQKLTEYMCYDGVCLCNPDCDCECLCKLIEGKDIMVFIGHITSDTPYDQLPDWTMFFVGNGLINIINGQLSGSYVKYSCDYGPWIKSLLGGEYCSNMAAQAGLPILDAFIEPDEVTVKQLPMLADLSLVKEADGCCYTMGDTVVFTVTLDNLGPSNATSVVVKDLLPEGLSYEGAVPSQGWYDVTSGYWSVGDLAADAAPVTLVITATVNTVSDEVCNRANVVALDQHDPITTNNMAEACISAAEPDPVDEVTLYLDEGYNLISLPLMPDVTNPVTALSGVTFDFSAMFIGSSKTTWSWEFYDPPAAPDPGFVWADGYGYWLVDVASGQTLTITGVELPAGATLPPSYDVAGGWNLIGFKSTTPKLPSEYLAGIEGKYVMIYGYDNDAFYAVGSPGHAMLIPGHGYWLAVKVGESGTIFP